MKGTGNQGVHSKSSQLSETLLNRSSEILEWVSGRTVGKTRGQWLKRTDLPLRWPKNSEKSQVLWRMPLIPALVRQRQADLYEFEGVWSIKRVTRQSGLLQRNPVLEYKQQKSTLLLLYHECGVRI